MVKELIGTYDLYIRLLIGELEELVLLGVSHGWKSTRHETGKLYREKIKALKSAVLAQQHLTGDKSEPEDITPDCEKCLIRREICPHTCGLEDCCSIYTPA